MSDFQPEAMVTRLFHRLRREFNLGLREYLANYYAEYLEWRAKGNIPAAYVEPPETTEQLEAKKLEALEIIDKASTRAIRELVLDQAGILNLTGPERAAAADRLKKENDKATAIRGR